MCSTKKEKDNWCLYKQYFFILNRKNILLNTKKLYFKKILSSKIFKSHLFLQRRFLSLFIRLSRAGKNFSLYLSLKNIKKNLLNSIQFKKEFFLVFWTNRMIGIF